MFRRIITRYDDGDSFFTYMFEAELRTSTIQVPLRPALLRRLSAARSHSPIINTVAYVAFLSGRAANAQTKPLCTDKITRLARSLLPDWNGGPGNLEGARGFVHYVGYGRTGEAGRCIPVVRSYVLSCTHSYVEDGAGKRSHKPMRVQSIRRKNYRLRLHDGAYIRP